MKSEKHLDQSSLISWYHDNHRDLPWRRTKDPYPIWISEVMLQQTTVVAVIPYYERFLKTFPTLKKLAEAPVENVLEMWSGLGYYSRARNLHKAAQALVANGGFPQTAAELEKLPGFGPYTSRAVSTFAFKEKVGVLDGNVIRVLSRRYGLPIQHWLPKEKNQLQILADELAQVVEPDNFNQAIMELGATVCTPANPSCLLCPWASRCVARQESKIADLPLKKPKVEFQTWVWQPEVMIHKGKVALMQNPELPFLKDQWVFPGEIKRVKSKPAKYDVKHGITKYDIYIQVKKVPHDPKKIRFHKWVALDHVKKVNPTAIIQKILECGRPEQGQQ
jgi:A/G-specific adenine glycosylase